MVSGARPRSAKLSPGFSVPPARLVDGGEKNGVLQGLGQEGDGAGELAALAGAALVVRGNDDGGDIDAFVGKLVHELESGHLGHLQIDDQTVRQCIGSEARNSWAER